MAESTLAAHDPRIDASTKGEITGEVAVGSYIVQVGSMRGGVIYTQPPEERPRIYPRSSPVMLRPRPFPGLLNREHEAASALAALLVSQPLEVYGQEGIGKTSLLRRLAFEATTSSFPDGIVFLGVHGRPLADVQQRCYDAFFESSAPLKPTDAELHHALQEKRALILLDDVDLERGEISELLGFAPNCSFALTAEERRVWDEGYVEALEGLPPDDALQLIQRELERPLAAEEQDAALAVCAALGYHPLHIIQATALIREEHRSFAALAQDLQTDVPDETLRAATLSHLSEKQRQTLAALVAIPGAALTVEHLAAVTGLEDIAAIASGLERHGLIREERNLYRPIGKVGTFLRREVDLTPWAERLVASLTIWAERRQHTPEQLQDYLDTLLAALAWANTASRWSDVLRLERAIDAALIVSRRWAAWRQALQWSLEAAQALDDRAAEAWALHQLGTRALCLGEDPVALTALMRALDMRTSQGDEIGAAVTRHNLALLSPPTVPLRGEGQAVATGQGPSATRLPLWAKVALGLALAVALGLGTWLVVSLIGGQGATEFTPSSGLAFANQEVGSSGKQPLTVTMRNGYTATITMETVTLDGANPGDFRIISDSCTGQNLTSDQTCAIAVAFAPTAAGERSATLNITSTAKDSPRAIPLQGTGIAAPVSGVDPSALDFGSVEVGQQGTSQSLTMTNSGTTDLTVSNTGLTGANPGDFRIISDNCTGQRLTSGQTCAIAVGFVPTAAGERSATLNITSTAKDSPRAIPLQGTGVTTPKAGLTPTRLEFGSLTVNSISSAQNITVKNIGTGDLTVTKVGLAGANPGDFSVTSSDCVSKPITPGKSCNLAVSFAPKAVGGRAATILISDTAAGSPYEVALSGTGVGTPVMLIKPDPATPIDFGAYAPTDPAQPAPPERTITLTNTGTSDLTIMSAAIGGKNESDFSVVSTDCVNRHITPSKSCSLVIRFKPTEASANTIDREATLYITDNTASKTHEVHLKGQVVI